MGWSCTQKQTDTLDAISRACEPGTPTMMPYFIEWPTAGRDYGTPDDQMIPAELFKFVEGMAGARHVGRFYIAPDGSIPGRDVPAILARVLVSDGELKIQGIIK